MPNSDVFFSVTQAVEETAEMPVIWDALTFMYGHCNCSIVMSAACDWM